MADDLVRFRLDFSIDDGKLGAFESIAQTMTAGAGFGAEIFNPRLGFSR